MRRGGFVRLPPHGSQQTIGLLGGSFNPPHEGHRLISELALKRLRLDRVWWLVTPGNPLKSLAELAKQEARVAAARAIARHPRIAVTDFEAEIGSRHTYQSLKFLRAALRRSSLCLDHGRRQPFPVSSLATLARHRKARADRHRRPARLDLRRALFARRTGARAPPLPRMRSGKVQAPEPACDPLSPRAALRAFLDRLARNSRISSRRLENLMFAAHVTLQSRTNRPASGKDAHLTLSLETSREIPTLSRRRAPRQSC